MRHLCLNFDYETLFPIPPSLIIEFTLYSIHLSYDVSANISNDIHSLFQVYAFALTSPANEFFYHS